MKYASCGWTTLMNNDNFIDMMHIQNTCFNRNISYILENYSRENIHISVKECTGRLC